MKWSLVVFLSFFVLNSANLFDKNSEANYRLPRNVKPINYTVDLALNSLDENTDTFTGTVAIYIEIIEDTYEIKLHGKNLVLTLTLLWGVLIKTSEPEDDTDIMTITTETKLKKGEIHKLQISFKGKLNENEMSGFYKSPYKETINSKTVTKYVATTQFEPTYARMAFPCFDEPNFKAVFQITITVPEGFSVQSNTPVETSLVTGSGTRTTFKPTPIMATYLIAFTVSEFTSDASTIDSVHYGVWSRKETANKRKLALQHGPVAISALEKITGKTYASSGIGKMDVYAIPDLSFGAMENWGHVTFRETALLYDENNSPISLEQYITRVITHEFTHMWFGDLVTLYWWSDVFLNEGFAEYFEYFAIADIKPEWELDKQFVILELHSALSVDSDPNAIALSSNVWKPEDISNRFDTISYEKGCSVIRMVVNLMGKDNFTKGIQNYLSTYEFKNTKPDHLWSSLATVYSKSSDLDLVNIMSNWTYKPGYPVLTINASGNNVVIKQKRFLVSGEDSTEWYVPITYRTTKNNDFSVTTPTNWLKPGKNLTLTDVLKDEEWIVFNTQQTGYYRVLYDNVLLSKIEAVLNKNHNTIHVLNRAHLIDDLAHFAHAGIISYNKFLSSISYLKNEIEYYPWYVAFNSFTKILNDASQNQDQIEKHIAILMQNLYKSHPVDKVQPNNHTYTMTQILAVKWACKLQNQDCIDSVTSLFEKFQNDANKKPDKNLREVVYCSYLRAVNNSSVGFEYLWTQFKVSNDAYERTSLLKALGCTQDLYNINKYLESIFASDSKIRLLELSTAVSSVYSDNNQAGLNALLTYLVSNYEKVHNRYGKTNSVKSLIKSLSDKFNSQDQYDKLKSLLNNDKVPEDVQTVAKSSIAKADERLRSIQNMEKELSEYFAQNDNFGNKVNYNVLLLILSFFFVTFINVQ